MNIRDLHYVVLLAELKHFGKAAEAAKVSQPTLSAQVRKLEETLGVVLFERDSRNVMPTAAGLAVVAEAKRALAHVAAIGDAAADFKDPLAGVLRLGVIASVGPYLVPDLLDQVQFEAPRLTVVVKEGLTDDLLTALAARELDAVILASDVPDGMLDVPLYEEPFVLAHGVGHRLAGLVQAGVQDVGEGELLLLEEGHCLREQALGVCMTGAADERVKATSLATLTGLVARGRGVTLLPLLAVHDAGQGVVIRKLGDGKAVRQVRLAVRKNYARMGAAQVLAQAARQVVQERLAGA